jgi:hypothetical protein
MQFATDGTAPAGDILATHGDGTDTSVNVTSATLVTMATTNTITLSGNSNQIFSFGTTDNMTLLGSQNTIYAGPGETTWDLTGNFNMVRGGQETATVDLDSDAAAANFSGESAPSISTATPSRRSSSAAQEQ